MKNKGTDVQNHSHRKPRLAIWSEPFYAFYFSYTNLHTYKTVFVLF